MKFHGWLDKDMKYLLKYQPKMVIDLDVLVKRNQKVPELSSKSSISQVSIENNQKVEKGELTPKSTGIN